MDDSDHFILLASPEAARSTWVSREIEHWLDAKSADRILPVVTDGTWEWDALIGDFTEDSTAVPDVLRGTFTEEPLFLDLRWARHDRHLTLRHSRFRDAVAQLAAPMHGISKDELESEDVRQHRRARRLRIAAVVSLVGLALLSVVVGILAVNKAAQATAAARAVIEQQNLVAQQRGTAERFAAEARLQEDIANQQQSRAIAAGAEADRQQKLAQRHRRLARRSSAEARQQLRNAERAAARARQQQRLAQRQAALARESAREMRRQEKRAKEQESLAQKQTELAAKASAEAEAQELKAQEQRQKAKRSEAESKLQERIAIGRRLVNEAKESLEGDPQTALKLGIAAQRISSDVEFRTELAGIVNATRTFGRLPMVKTVEAGPGSLIATLDEDGTASMWDVTDRIAPRRLATMGETTPAYARMDLSPNGKALLLVQRDAQLWDLTDPSAPKLAATFPDDDRRPARAAFSPDGRTLATADWSEPEKNRRDATLWNITDLNHPIEISALYEPASPQGDLLEFSGDGRTLVVGTHVWDVSHHTKPVLRSKIDDTGSFQPLALSRSEPPVLAGVRPGELTVYSLAEPAKPVRIARSTDDVGDIASLTISSDGKDLASGNTAGSVNLWDIENNGLRPAGTTARKGTVGSVAFSADDRTLVSVDESMSGLLWGVTDNVVGRPVSRVAAHADLMENVVYSRDGRSIISVAQDKTAAVWDVTDPAKPVRRAKLAMSSAFPKVSADGTTIADQDDNMVTLIDLTDPTKPSTLTTFKPRSTLRAVAALSPNGGMVAVYDDDADGTSQVEIWDLSDRRHPVWRADVPTDGKPIFSPDASTLAIENAESVDLWDLSKFGAARKISTMPNGNAVSSVAFSPDGDTVAVSGLQGVTTLWNIKDRTRPHAFVRLKNPNGRYLDSVTFSKDGTTLATSVVNWETSITDSWVTLWDVTRLRKPVRLASLKLPGGAVPAPVAFSPNGTALTVAYDVLLPEENDQPRPTPSHEFQWWDLTEPHKLRADPARIGCAIAGGGLTADEWPAYVPEVPYRQTCDG